MTTLLPISVAFSKQLIKVSNYRFSICFALAILALLTLSFQVKAQSQTVCSGSSVTFTVPNINSQSQWQVSTTSPTTGFTNINGQTNLTYTFTASAADNGKYFRVRFTNNGGQQESFSDSYLLTVHTSPIAPTTSGASRCGNGSVTLSASGTPTGGAYQWYTGLTGSNAISGATSATYTTPSLSATTTYYVAIVNQCGTSTRTAVTATINPTPTAPTTTDGFRCGAGTVTLTASGTTNGNYRWYTVATGGTAIAGATNATYTTPSLTVNRTYYVSVVNSSNCESARTPVTAIIENLNQLVVTGASKTGPGSLALTATGTPAGGSYNWYANSTGGTPIVTNTQGVFLTPVLTSTTTYYVAAISGRGCGEGNRVAVTATILPVTYAGNLTSHVILYHENFSGYTGTQTAAGMTTPTTTIDGTTNPQWNLQPTNVAPVASTGKVSGGHYIRTNLSATNTSSLTDRVLTLNNGISTADYEHIGIIWSHRQTYSSTDANRPRLQYSTNNGSTWIDVTGWSNTTSTSWALANGGNYILLPTSASSVSNIQIRWIAPNSPANQSDFYALDDITLIGTPKVGLNSFSWRNRPNGENPFTASVTNPESYTEEGLALKWSVATNSTTINTSLSYVSSTQFQSTPLLSLVQTGADETTRNSVITLQLSSSVSDLTFSIFDLDTSPGQFRDNLEIIGYNGATPVQLTKNKLITSSKNEFVNGRISGIAGLADTPASSSEANITVTFPSMIDRVVITYRNTDATRNNSGQQGIGIHDIMWRTLTIAPLPVELVNFKATAQQNQVQLNWSTASETDNDHFEVERSQDGRTFTKIGTVKGKGTSSLTNHYAFKDGNPGTGTNYYRLRQVDFDGKFEYSKTVTAHLKAVESSIKAFPNPFSDQLRVAISTSEQDVVRLQLMDLQGKVVMSQELTIDSKYKELELDTQSLATGLYILKIKGAYIDTTTKLIKSN